MARFRIAKLVPLGNAPDLGKTVAAALADSATQSVEVVLRSGGYEVRVWEELRDDVSNRANASANVDYHC